MYCSLTRPPVKMGGRFAGGGSRPTPRPLPRPVQDKVCADSGVLHADVRVGHRELAALVALGEGGEFLVLAPVHDIRLPRPLLLGNSISASGSRVGGKFRFLNPRANTRSSVSKTFSKFVPPIRSLPALPIMFTNALSRRKAAVACVAVSMSSIRALGQSTSQIFGPSRRHVATPYQSPPSARDRGAGAFGGVVGRRARSSWTSCDSSTFVRHSTAPTFPLPSSDPYDAVYVVRWAAGRRHRRRRPRDNLSLGTPNGPSELSRSVSPATRRPIHDTVCCTW